MERFVAESDEYRRVSVHELITLKGKTVVITGEWAYTIMAPYFLLSCN